MANDYRRVKDIYSVPCAKRISGEKCIAVCGRFAYVQYADGMRTYYRRNTWDMWECIREELCTNA